MPALHNPFLLRSISQTALIRTNRNIGSKYLPVQLTRNEKEKQYEDD